MGRFLAITTTILVFVSAPSSAADSALNGQALTEKYDQLVPQLNKGDANIDFGALRLAYTATPQYDAYGSESDDLLDEIGDAYRAGNCDSVLKKSEEFLNLDFIWVNIHAIRAECFAKLGETNRANLESSIARGLENSLLNSGDGKSEATAYKVMTMREERFVLSQLRVTEQKQALVQGKDGPFDVIDGPQAPSGNTLSLWFDIRYIFSSLDSLCGNEKP